MYVWLTLHAMVSIALLDKEDFMEAGYSFHLSCGVMTDVGRQRKNNEDAVLAILEHGVFCVADGMGGSDAGEVASSKVVDHIRNAFSAIHVDREARIDRTGVLCEALGRANGWIRDYAATEGMKSCGTTAVAIAFDEVDHGKAMAVHAGDSRAYRLRGGELQQLTRDHSFAEAAGLGSEDLVPARFRSVITRAIGIMEEPNLERTAFDVAAADIYLLCSDGLSRMLPDEWIGNLLSEHRHGDPSVMAERLVAAANEAGGHDNISVIVILVTGGTAND